MTDFLRRVVALRALAQTGSVTRAAARLHKVPSAVSYDLHKLATEVGVALFSKQGRGLRLTRSGEVLAQAMDRAYGEVMRGVEHARRGDAADEPLRLACVSGFGRYRLVPALLRALPSNRPLEVSFGTAVEVLARVESGAAALGISYKPLVTTAVEQRKIATESLVLIAAKGAARPRIRDVSRQRFVTYWEFEYVFDAWFRAHAMPPPTRWQRADHVEELEEAIEAVAAGRGLCIVPLDAAQSPAFRTRVMVLEHAGRRCRNDLYLLASPERVRGRDADLLQHAARKRWRG